MKKITLGILLLISTVNLVSAAHWIVGYVNNASDGEPANGKTVTLWNYTAGSSNNLTDVVGPTGNSGQDNFYFIDCEASPIQCVVGDLLTVKIFNNGSGYFTNEVNVTVSGAGFTTADNLSFIDPIGISGIEVDDDLSFPLNEINPLPATTKTITCSAILTGNDESEIKNASAVFFSGSYSNPDDNNNHYTNSSCELNLSYGDSTQVKANCNFDIEYYADAGTWNCTLKAYDIYDNPVEDSITTTMNTLLAIGIQDSVDYGNFATGTVSDEKEINITNYGNVRINLSISGYGANIDDGNAMNCTLSEGIPIYYEKYNFSKSTTGSLNLSEFEKAYTNLTSNPIIESFKLNYRQQDGQNEAINQTYWRIYVPQSVAGNCSGNLVFGATQSPE